MHDFIAPNAVDLEGQGIPLDHQLPQEARVSQVVVDGYALAIADIPAHSDVEQRGIALLVPGFTSALSTFFPLLAPLSARGYRVITMSQRGQAGSAGPTDPGDYQLARLAADVSELLTALHIQQPVHLLGHSFGGIVAGEAIIAEPSRWASLTLWNSGPYGLQGEFDEVIAGIDAHGVRSMWVTDRTAKGLDPMLDRLNELNPVERYYFDRLMNTQPAQLKAALGILRDQSDRTQAIAQSKVPVLISHGANDDAWPIELQRAMAEKLTADYWVIAHAGHSAHNDRTHTSAQLLATFWDEHGHQ